jgi:hypothetical protein
MAPEKGDDGGDMHIGEDVPVHMKDRQPIDALMSSRSDGILPMRVAFGRLPMEILHNPWFERTSVIAPNIDIDINAEAKIPPRSGIWVWLEPQNTSQSGQQNHLESNPRSSRASGSMSSVADSIHFSNSESDSEINGMTVISGCESPNPFKTNSSDVWSDGMKMGWPRRPCIGSRSRTEWVNDAATRCHSQLFSAGSSWK